MAAQLPIVPHPKPTPLSLETTSYPNPASEREATESRVAMPGHSASCVSSPTPSYGITRPRALREDCVADLGDFARMAGRVPCE